MCNDNTANTYYNAYTYVKYRKRFKLYSYFNSKYQQVVL